MTAGKDRFFFEEDPEAGAESGLTWEEHTDAFLNFLGDSGNIKDKAGISLEPMQTGVDMKTEHHITRLLDIEYGVVKSDYVIHITPIHPHKNLTAEAVLKKAVLAAIAILGQIIPTTLPVRVFLPRKDFEVKAISFVVVDGAEAWNLDHAEIKDKAVPELVEQIEKICMQA